MKWFKIMLIVFVSTLLIIQFFPAAQNSSKGNFPGSIEEKYLVPASVQSVLKRSCYDCHSNNTVYPWYSRIQPFSWWLSHHIKEGKQELNFNEFGNYSRRRQVSKFNSIAKSIQNGSMPLKSFLLMHTQARLSNEEKAMVVSWANKLKDSLILTK
jgi:hypothetical protein